MAIKFSTILSAIKELVPLSGPMILAKIGVPLRGLAMTWIFALLGPLSMSGGALAYSLLIAAQTFLVGIIATGVGVHLAYATGEEDDEQTRDILHQGVWLGVMLAALITLIFYSSSLFLKYLGQAPKVITAAVPMIHAMAWMMVPISIVIAMYKLLINVKHAKYGLIYSLIGTASTIGFAYLFAVKLHWGMAGVGWGLSASYILSASLVLLHITFAKPTRHLRVVQTFSWPKFDVIKKLFELGWPMGIKYNVEYFMFFVIATLIGLYDHQELAVYQVMMQFFLLASCLATGVGLGAEALVGQAIGGGKTKNILPGTVGTILLAVFYVLIAVLVIFGLSHHLSDIFFKHAGADDRLFLYTFSFVAIYMFVDTFRKILIDLLATFKDTRMSLLVEIISLWIISLPLGYYIGFKLHWGILGIIIGLIVGGIMSVITLGRRLNRMLKKY